MSIILFIIILAVLVISHEFGHFIVARAFGIRVDEFGFGYPPRAFKLFKKGDTTYTVNWLPFGGFVKIFGENPDEENTNGPDKARSFVHKPRYAQALVLVAGVVANLILAWILFSVGFMAGLPSSAENIPKGARVENIHLVITSVSPDSPAEEAGLLAGDSIIAIADKEVRIEKPTASDLQQFVVAHAPDELTLTYSRKQAEKSVALSPKDGITPDHPAIGISMDMIGTLKLPFFRALGEGARLTARLTKDTVASLGNLIGGAFTGTAHLSDVTGPVGIVGVVGDAYKFGLLYLLSFTALISINLAIINLIPFPALDGGRLLFLLIEKIKGSRMNPKVSNTINAVGFFLLIALMLVVTYHDIAKLL